MAHNAIRFRHWQTRPVAAKRAGARLRQTGRNAYIINVYPAWVLWVSGKRRTFADEESDGFGQFRKALGSLSSWSPLNIWEICRRRRKA